MSERRRAKQWRKQQVEESRRKFLKGVACFVGGVAILGVPTLGFS